MFDIFLNIQRKESFKLLLALKWKMLKLFNVLRTKTSNNKHSIKEHVHNI